MPGNIVGGNLMGFPASSNGADMLNVDSTDEKIKNSERVAMAWPGQILVNTVCKLIVTHIILKRNHLRPYPKAATLSLMSVISLPSFKNLSGRNSSGSG